MTLILPDRLLKFLGLFLAFAMLLTSWVRAGVVVQAYYEFGDADQPVAGTPGASITRDISIFRRALTRIDDLNAGVPNVRPGVLAAYNGNAADGSSDPAMTPASIVATALSLGNSGNTAIKVNDSSDTPLPVSAPFIWFVPNSSTLTATDGASSVSADSYISFTVSPSDEADALYLTSLTLKAERGGASTPRGFSVRCSVDGFATDLVGSGDAGLASQRPAFTPFTADLSGPQFQGLGSITFRIYGFGPVVGNSIDFDDITLNGVVALGPGQALSPTLTEAAPPASGSNAFPREGNRYSMQFGQPLNSGAAGFGHYEYNVQGSPAPVITTTDDFGIEAYLFLTSNNTGTAIPFYNGNPNDTGWGIAIDSAQNLTARIGTGAAVVNFGSYHVSLNQWIHVALVRNAGTATLYVNGTVAGADSADIPSFSSATARPMTLQVGASFTDRTTAFPGLIDEVRVFTFAQGKFNSAIDLLNRNLGVNAPSPQPPTNLGLTGLTSTSATFAWNPSPGPGDNASYTGVVSYTLLAVTVVSGSNVYTAMASGLTSPTCTVTGLAPGAVSAWVLQGFDSLGNASAPTMQFTVTNPQPAVVSMNFPVHMSNGSFQFTAQGAANQTALVEATSSLDPPVSWQIIQSFMPATATFSITDSAAGQYTQRFYKVVQP